MLITNEVIFTVFHVVADSRSTKELHVVFQAHKEDPVLFILAIDLLPHLWCPLFRFVTPIAFPFLHAIWITNLTEAHIRRLIAQVDIFSTNHSVCMAIL